MSLALSFLVGAIGRAGLRKEVGLLRPGPRGPKVLLSIDVWRFDQTGQISGEMLDLAISSVTVEFYLHSPYSITFQTTIFDELHFHRLSSFF